MFMNANFISLMRKRGMTHIPPKPKRDHGAERLSLIRMARVMTSGITNDTDKKVVIGMLTDGIFQREHISTGLASSEANKLPAANQTKEHYHGRKQSAVELVDTLIQNPEISDEELMYFLIERCRVHHVTKSQNMKLRKYTMDNVGVTWQEAYSACGISLEQRVTQKRGRKPNA
jgi:hypothetical protein